MEQLKSCLTTRKNSTPIGILTSDHRDNWGRAYQELLKDPLNKSSLEVIQKSLFILSLDDLVPDNDTYYNKSCHQLITGGGADFNTGNRWYDKTVQVRKYIPRNDMDYYINTRYTFQFIVGEQGINGLTYEHSPAEGQPIAVLTDYILGYIKKSPELTDTYAVGKRQQPEELKFNVTEKVQELVNSSAKNINK